MQYFLKNIAKKLVFGSILIYNYKVIRVKEEIYMVTLDKIYHASYVLKDVVIPTPLVKATAISDDCEVYLKPENLQITGSFKVRGSGYKISQLTEEERSVVLLLARQVITLKVLRLPQQNTVLNHLSACLTALRSLRLRLQRVTAQRFVWYRVCMTMPTIRLVSFVTNITILLFIRLTMKM